MRNCVLVITTLISISSFAQTQELPTQLTLQLDTAHSPSSYYNLPRNAWFKLPAFLNVNEIQYEENSVKIFYNQISANNYEFHCSYKSLPQSNYMQFEKCETMSGELIISNVSDISTMDFPMDLGSGIKMELLGTNNRQIKISADYIVDWK